MSATPTQIINIIRYNLSEVGARNSHHEFEHLCRHLARLRVYSNVIPATGPVSAGGDAGRDFETFRTSLGWPLTAGSTFAGRSSGSRKVAFACSLQQQIEAKIRGDVNDILAGGPADEVIYFCEANLPVAKRHTLQRWAKSEHEVELQIFDGQAIAELLSERDTFWIAQEYLRIPAELMPSSADDPDWYRNAIDRWSGRDPIPISQFDFLEIKWALRRATFHLEARPELLLWIKRMECFVAAEVPRSLQRTALYELAVASLRGKGEMSSQLQRMHDFFRDFEDWLDVADLQDGATLTVYAFGAWALGQLEIDPAELFDWRQRVAICLDQQIAEAPGPGRRSGLLEVRGFLCVLPLQPGGSPQIDQGFELWTRMLDEAELTPLFPIENFADYLVKIAAGFGKHPRFAPLTERVDALVAKRAGQAAVGGKIYNRAVAYYERHDLLSAIHELHRVQEKWFSGDAMPRFQQAISLLAKCYLELHLPYAAKYHALVAAYIARYSDNEEVAHTLPTMLFLAADADDGAGNSLSFLQLLLVALEAHCRLDPDPLDVSKHAKVQTNLGQVAALRGLATRAGPEFSTVIDHELRLWPVPLRDLVVKASDEPTGFWTQGSWDEVWTTIQDNFLGRPFGDLGPTRVIEWRALGLQWSATFDNNYLTTSLVEQFVAELQIALAALAGLDLCLLPTRVQLQLSVRRYARKFKVIEPDGFGQGFGVSLSIAIPGGVKIPQASDEARQVVLIVGMIIRRCSVLPNEDLFTPLEHGLKAAADRVFIGRPYAELCREFFPVKLFHADQRRSTPPFLTERPFNLPENLVLSWVDGPGPTYSVEVADHSVRGRYERCNKCVGITVRRLMETPETRQLIESLHLAGMKDWEILSIIANVAINIRMPLCDNEEPSPEHIERFRAALETEEDLSTALAAELFTEELIEANRRLFLGAFLSGWGLTLASNAIDMQALETFLTRRYGLRSDDRAHPDIFRWSEMGRAPTESERR
jgi:hypothetical protein